MSNIDGFLSMWKTFFGLACQLHNEVRAWIPFFDGYVTLKNTLKQFVEQYENALRSKVEKEKKDDFKSRHIVFDCLTVYGFEKQFQDAYTNAKFKEVQAEIKRLLYCQLCLVKEAGSIYTYFVKVVVVVFEKIKHVDFVIYYNSTEFDM